MLPLRFATAQIYVYISVQKYDLNISCVDVFSVFYSGMLPLVTICRSVPATYTLVPSKFWFISLWVALKLFWPQLSPRFFFQSNDFGWFVSFVSLLFVCSVSLGECLFCLFSVLVYFFVSMFVIFVFVFKGTQYVFFCLV